MPLGSTSAMVTVISPLSEFVWPRLPAPLNDVDRSRIERVGIESERTGGRRGQGDAAVALACEASADFEVRASARPARWSRGRRRDGRAGRSTAAHSRSRRGRSRRWPARGGSARAAGGAWRPKSAAALASARCPSEHEGAGTAEMQDGLMRIMDRALTASGSRCAASRRWPRSSSS